MEKQYKCSKCGKLFSDLISEPEQDYPGGHISVNFMSPCCGAGYFDEW